MRIQLQAYASYHGIGPFHPAICQGHSIVYWANISFAQEGEAIAYAAKVLHNAEDAANYTIATLNLTKG